MNYLQKMHGLRDIKCMNIEGFFANSLILRIMLKSLDRGKNSNEPNLVSPQVHRRGIWRGLLTLGLGPVRTGGCRRARWAWRELGRGRAHVADAGNGARSDRFELLLGTGRRRRPGTAPARTKGARRGWRRPWGGGSGRIRADLAPGFRFQR